VLGVKVFLQAADRRDRLIYVLSQINAARGDDSMHVDDESSDESEEEVCIVCLF
jgi:U4/U6 small nuclear ribonucleoprotein PRP4